MKRIFIIFFTSIIFLLTGCETKTLPELSLTGKVVDASDIYLKNTILALGILSWRGAPEKESKQLAIPINDSTKITDAKGKEVKIESLKQNDKIIAIFEDGTKIISPFPGEASKPALKIIKQGE